VNEVVHEEGTAFDLIGKGAEVQCKVHRGKDLRPQVQAYARFDDEMARTLRSGLKVQVARNKFVSESNLGVGLVRFEMRKEIAGLALSMKEIRKNIKMKKPKMLHPRVESSVFSLAMTRGYHRKESLLRLREYFKAKKKAIASGKPIPKAEDYLY
jgi:hypothetical protein